MNMKDLFAASFGGARHRVRLGRQVWARIDRAKSRLHAFLPINEIAKQESDKETYLIRWRNTTPRATPRRVFRRGLYDGPGIGDVTLAIIARTCSSLEEVDDGRSFGGPSNVKVYRAKLTCALAD